MIRRLGRLLAAAALTAAAAFTGVGVTASPAAAAAQPMSQCSTTTGVVLAVDFSHWGGPVLRACGSTPTTGYQLLNEGGWQSAGTQHDGPGFICRIGYSGFQNGTEFPTPSQDACVLTPPTTAYWSYWHADPGQNTWSYSQLGAMNYHPEPGSVDLWTFGGTNDSGSGGRPSFPPSAVRAANAAPGAPATQAPPPSRRTATGPGAPARPGTGKAAGGGAAPATSTPTASGPGSAAPSGTASPPAGAAPRVVNAPPTAAARSSGGSSVPTVIGVVAGVVLVAAAALAAWRRRRAGQAHDGD